MVVLFPKPVLLVTHSVRMPRDYISCLLRARGYPTIWVRPFMGQPLPSPDPEAFSGAVFYGGPQLLTEIDADPFLQDEINWVRAFVEGGGRYLGLCLGMQIAVIDFSRNVLGLKNANSTEFDPESIRPPQGSKRACSARTRCRSITGTDRGSSCPTA